MKGSFDDTTHPCSWIVWTCYSHSTGWIWRCLRSGMRCQLIMSAMLGQWHSDIYRTVFCSSLEHWWQDRSRVDWNSWVQRGNWFVWVDRMGWRHVIWVVRSNAHWFGVLPNFCFRSGIHNAPKSYGTILVCCILYADKPCKRRQVTSSRERW